jgi:hypothetical protein
VGLTEIGCECVDWIHLAQDNVYWWADEKVMNLWVISWHLKLETAHVCCTVLSASCMTLKWKEFIIVKSS